MKNSAYPSPLTLLICATIVISVVTYVAIVKFSPENVSKAEVLSNPPEVRYTNTNIDLPPGVKLVDAGVECHGPLKLYIWHVVRPMREDEVPERREIMTTESTNDRVSVVSKVYLVEHVKGDSGQSIP